MNEFESAPDCLMRAWHAHERELLAWLTRQLGEHAAAEDTLQDVFIKALRQERRFCEVENARAWLFEVTRNAAADQLRRKRETVELPQELVAEDYSPSTVDSLASCLPRVLTELSVADREAITCCDLQGMSQEDYARRIGLSLPAAKSRVQRARKRLKAQLSSACQIKLDQSGRVCCYVPRVPLNPELHS